MWHDIGQDHTAFIATHADFHLSLHHHIGAIRLVALSKNYRPGREFDQLFVRCCHGFCALKIVRPRVPHMICYLNQLAVAVSSDAARLPMIAGLTGLLITGPT